MPLNEMNSTKAYIITDSRDIHVNISECLGCSKLWHVTHLSRGWQSVEYGSQSDVCIQLHLARHILSTYPS